MVYLRLRENGSHPVVRNASAPEPSTAALGLTERVDGYYDRAGRRLFLADGAPDPLTPGAYRYRAHPDLCDPTAPETDPASPRYEPPHLRHRPGDTWEIGGRPHDPDDPGPYGTAGWRPDTRTGRHRRAELPDPIPPQGDDTREPGPVAQPGEPDGPAPVPSRFLPDQAPREPKRRNRFWRDDDDDRGHGEVPHGEPHRFTKLQEDAWDRFMIKSSELAAAHWANRRSLDARHPWMIAVVLRLLRWTAGVVTGNPVVQPEPSPLPAEPRPAPPAPPRPGTQMAQAVRGAQAARTLKAGRTPATQEATAGAAREARAGAIRATQVAAGVAGAPQATRTGATHEAAQRDQHARRSTHWRSRPREDRPRPSPLPYIARWERAFDAHRSFGEAVAL